MHPKVREALNDAVARFGIPADEILGPKRRRTALAVHARWHMIRCLYDPGSEAVSGTSRFAWSKSRVAKEMDLDHTSVLYALSRDFTNRFAFMVAAATDDEILTVLPATTQKVTEVLRKRGYSAATPAAVRKRLTKLHDARRVRFDYDAMGTPIWSLRRAVSLSGIASHASLTR